MDILSLLLFLLVASACAYIGERLVPGVVPGGFLTLAIVGVIGAWIGGNLMGHIGPDLAGISLVPCIIGSALLVFLMSLIFRGFNSSRA
ncbi:MAG: GlsB/YeaQ/YmgE family stress response membrane protein [Candidatus Obscuribacterales bacterium]|nr:GlsB/YeaQ/YmgE family stress response membrane protein [Candidatus Obscuribacterales bacterium]